MGSTCVRKTRPLANSITPPFLPHLASDVVLDKKIFALVVEDDVDLLCAGAADVWTKHDVVV